MEEKKEEKKEEKAEEKSWYTPGITNPDDIPVMPSRGSNRFWLKEGTEKPVIIVEDSFFGVWEHNPRIDGSWFNYFTCTEGLSDCPLCAADIYRYYIGALTVLDLSEWTDKQGKMHKNERKLLVAKADSIKKLLRRKEREGGSLVGCMFNVYRSGEKSPNIGDDWELLERVKLEDYGNPEAFDYLEEFKPKSIDELEAIAKKAGSSEKGKAGEGVSY